MSNGPPQQPSAFPDPASFRPQRPAHDPPGNLSPAYSPPAQYDPRRSYTPSVIQPVYYPDRSGNSSVYPRSRSYRTPTRSPVQYDAETNLPHPVLDVPFTRFNGNTIQPQRTASNSQLGAVQQCATLINLDGPATISAENMSLVKPKSVEWDGQWFTYLTSVPMKLGNCYLLEDETMIPVPENMVDGKTYVRCTDVDGPPLGSALYGMWQDWPDREIARLRCKEYLTLAELQVCRLHHDQNNDYLDRRQFDRVCFILPLAERQSLYRKLFHEINFDVDSECHPVDPYVEDIIASKVNAILFIEDFILRVLLQIQDELKLGCVPNLRLFVEDFCDVIDSLISTKIEISKLEEHLRLDQVTWWLDENNSKFSSNWKKRWESVGVREFVSNKDVKRNYICALLDTAFGLWKSPGNCFWHDPPWKPTSTNQCEREPQHVHPYSIEHWVLMQNTIPRCIHDRLYFWEEIPPQPDGGSDNTTAEDVMKSASISLGPMDALLIHRRIPFKFEPTGDLEKHLTIKAGHGRKAEDQREIILIFNDWRRFLMLRHHKVLIDDASPEYPKDQVSLFQLLARSTRTAQDRISGKGVDVRSVAYEVLQTYALLFYRHVSDEGGEYYDEAQVDRTFFWWYRRWRHIGPQTSEEIAHRWLGLGLDNGSRPRFRQLVNVLAHLDNTVPQSADFKVFRKRLEDLNRTFNAWKPSTLSEVRRYRGWVEEETSYWQWVIAVIGIPFLVVGFFVNLVVMFVTVFPRK